MMRPVRTKAIILRRTNYGEADRVVSLLTPDHGKLSAIAKGVRKPKSKLAGGLELFAVCDITLLGGRGDVALVTSARINEFFGDILQQYERMELAYRMIKDVNRATETVSEPEFFYLLRDGLQYLNTSSIDWRLIELWFRVQVRILLGHAVNTATDKQGSKLKADITYDFDFTEQAFYEHGTGRFTALHITLLRLVSTKNPAVLRQVGGTEQVLDDCLLLARSLES